MRQNHIKFWKLFTITLSLCSILGPVSYAEHGSSANRNTPVSRNEIKSWTYFDPFWSGALDANGDLLALYDLSYPTLLDKIELGVFDPSIQNYDKVIQLLSEAQARGLPQSHREDWAASVSIKLLKKLRAKNGQLSISETGSVLPPNWWKTIPWRNGKGIVSQSDSAPQRFLLSDIDFRSIVKRIHHHRFDKKLAEIGGASFFEQFEFVQDKNGTYRIYWSPKQTASSMTTPVTQLPKLVDFTCLKCGLRDSLIFDAIDNVLNGLVSFIPVPVAAGLVSVALGEAFQFQRELFNIHQSMALEMLKTADEKTPYLSPFAPLSPASRQFAVNYILYAKSTLVESIRWTFQKPELEWAKQEGEALTLAQESANYLTAKGHQLTLLNSRFALGIGPDQFNNIFLLSAPRYGNIFPPFVGINYHYPYLTRNIRLGIEVAHMLVFFLRPSIPYPGVGPVIALAFKYLIERPIQEVKNWESRLSAHLNTRVGENWTRELDLLYQQTINPFEISPKKAADLVRKRKESLGQNQLTYAF